MKEKMPKIIQIIVIIALIVLGIVIGDYYRPFKVGENKPSVSVIEGELSEIAELASAEYYYTNMAKYENYTEFYGVKIPFTTTRFIIAYDGVIKAGIKMGNVKVQTNDRQIIITLPEAEILSHEIDYDSLAITDETYSIFNHLEITDYNQFYADQSKVVEEKALSRGLLEKAIENARMILTNFLSESHPNAEIIFR
ncbi:MAG: DUF4230 domain-containing protein [Erysipelotrichaceae bacterium]|nr:DUF4230 domain-containing protein [Erysipelotrichaceae bacterium]